MGARERQGDRERERELANVFHYKLFVLSSAQPRYGYKLMADLEEPL